MTAFKKSLTVTALAICLSVEGTASATGIPVIDIASIAQQVQQVAAWAQQYQQMVTQISEMQRQYQNLNGVRGMGSLVNSPASRQYLPAEYQQLLANGVGQWESIYNAARVFNHSTSSRLSTNDGSFIAFQGMARQAAINRAAAEEGYRTASTRFSNIQVLLDRINAAPDSKDIADLSARIQAEQVMMQNESNKLALLGQLAQSQRDLADQQAKERRMQSTRGTAMPNW